MPTLVEIAAELVAAHVKKSPLNTDELLDEIGKVHAALRKLESGELLENNGSVLPAVSAKDAFKKNEVVCLVCGKGGFKALARHLNHAHGLKPGQYKKQFGIPAKQALSAKSYSEARRKVALDLGLADNLARAREVRMAKAGVKEGAAKTARVLRGKAVPASAVAAVPARTTRKSAQQV